MGLCLRHRFLHAGSPRFISSFKSSHLPVKETLIESHVRVSLAFLRAFVCFVVNKGFQRPPNGAKRRPGNRWIRMKPSMAATTMDGPVGVS